MVTCTECGQNLSTSAKTCTSCGCKKPFNGKVLNVEETKALSSSERSSFQKGGGKLTLSGAMKFALFCSFSFLASVIILISSLPDTPPRAYPKYELASSHCRTQIREVANNPSSVEFIGDGIAYEYEPNLWYADMTFRATNGFNAIVVNKYRCVFVYKRDDFYLRSIKEID